MNESPQYTRGSLTPLLPDQGVQPQLQLTRSPRSQARCCLVSENTRGPTMGGSRPLLAPASRRHVGDRTPPRQLLPLCGPGTRQPVQLGGGSGDDTRSPCHPPTAAVVALASGGFERLPPALPSGLVCRLVPRPAPRRRA